MCYLRNVITMKVTPTKIIGVMTSGGDVTLTRFTVK